MLINYFSKLQ